MYDVQPREARDAVTDEPDGENPDERYGSNGRLYQYQHPGYGAQDARHQCSGGAKACMPLQLRVYDDVHDARSDGEYAVDDGGPAYCGGGPCECEHATDNQQDAEDELSYA